MIIRIYKKTMLFCVSILLVGVILAVTLPNLNKSSPNRLIAGGEKHPPLHITADVIPVNQQYADESERFQRPSKQLPLPNQYSFHDFQKQNNEPPLISKKFETPEDVILAYYGILRNASNMLGYSGGCGTIGESVLPYPYAYELLTQETQKKISPDQFIDSFKGIGYVTLLKIAPACTPPDTPPGIQYYMVEIEVITGAKVKNKRECCQGSCFAYYYGLITVEESPNNGFKIKDIDYIPEDFLCAPAHNWFYLSEAVVQIIYGDNMNIINKTDKTEQEGDMIYIYASGNGKQYRFDFIRITNGYDILLHENILENGAWKETSLLTNEWRDYKFAQKQSTKHENHP